MDADTTQLIRDVLSGGALLVAILAFWFFIYKMSK